MSRFAVLSTPIADLKIVQRQKREDSRGFLSRLFCCEELATAGWNKSIAQVNHTMTRKQGTIRGLHFQRPPYAEIKLVTCLRGAVWDVAVDLRAGSSTFLQWHAQEISASNHRALLIPAGFAHGFQTLCDDCELLYLHSMAYAPEAEAGLNPRDPTLSIGWPVAQSALSSRDAQHPLLDPRFQGVVL
jgi:dTDP-4-dehydrorhamnose 3,5-epimerase